MYRCQRGCRAPDGQGLWHRRKGDCPHEKLYRRDQPVVNTESVAPPPKESPVEEPKAEPKPGRKTLSFGEGMATTIKREQLQPNVAEGKPTFCLDKDHTKSFWNLIFRGVRRGTHEVDDYLEIGHMDERFFSLTPAELATIDREEQSWLARTATRTLVAMGAKTLDQAQGYVDDAELASTFGGLALAIVSHYRKGMKDSPRRKRDKAKKEAERLKKLGEEPPAEAEFEVIDEPKGAGPVPS